jgi:galactoside 2-L-fucosyltransferase 1/2
MSTGTFGWWAAWMAGGTTIYFDGWPRPSSALDAEVNKKDFFPPQWIAM